MTVVWKKAEKTVEAAPDTGDILMPLKRVSMRYYKRALRHEKAGKPERAKYYREQTANVERLINQ